MDLTILVIELFSEVEHPRRTEPCPEIQSWPPFGYGHCSTSQLVVWSSCSASTASSVLTLCGVGGPRLSRPGCSPPAHWTGHSQDQLFPVRPSVCPPWPSMARENKLKVDVTLDKCARWLFWSKHQACCSPSPSSWCVYRTTPLKVLVFPTPIHFMASTKERAQQIPQDVRVERQIPQPGSCCKNGGSLWALALHSLHVVSLGCLCKWVRGLQ